MEKIVVTVENIKEVFDKIKSLQSPKKDIELEYGIVDIANVFTTTECSCKLKEYKVGIYNYIKYNQSNVKIEINFDLGTNIIFPGMVIVFEKDSFYIYSDIKLPVISQRFTIK